MNSALLVTSAALVTYGLTALYVRAMSASKRLEPPSERGMHAFPVPSGAGVAIIAATLLFWPLAAAGALGRPHVVLLLAAVALAIVSWIDDQRRLAPAVRLALHALAISVLLALLEPDQRMLPALPLYAERVGLGIAWLWFVNLFNFMDGIDGLAGSEAVAIAAGYVTVVSAASIDTPLGALALILAAAAVGYLAWNWHPAKVFMGDAGSIPLGFLLGWLMIDLACRGYWPAALILPLYFAADATLTLATRLARGKKPWRPHREHFYQRAVLAGTPQAGVVRRINAVNVVLIGLALLSLRSPLPALVASAIVVAALLLHLQRLAGKDRSL